MHSECVQNVLFTNDEWASNQSSVKLSENLKKEISENTYAGYMLKQLFTTVSVNRDFGE